MVILIVATTKVADPGGRARGETAEKATEGGPKRGVDGGQVAGIGGGTESGMEGGRSVVAARQLWGRWRVGRGEGVNRMPRWIVRVVEVGAMVEVVAIR